MSCIVRSLLGCQRCAGLVITGRIFRHCSMIRRLCHHLRQADRTAVIVFAREPRESRIELVSPYGASAEVPLKPHARRFGR